MRTLPVIFSLMLTTTVFGQPQLILFMTEDFEQPSNTFAFDTGTVAPGTISGPNRWIINNSFDGGGIYPNTTRQDSITGGSILGTITNAPFSTYLHIHDGNAAPAIANANYDATAASDHFVYTSNSFCTLGLTDVTLTFFYLCAGSATAYGEVYYSVNGGAWLKTGAAKYNNQSKWEYVILTDPGFNNVEDLRIGFRWVNDARSAPSSISFGLDEIILVGTYDPNAGPDIIIPNIVPGTVCQQKSLDSVYFQFTAPMCLGFYSIELSDAAGGFSNPTTIGGFGTNFTTITNYVYVGLPIPAVAPGGCYRLRINRNSPPPVIIGEASPCFRVIACPNTITTLPPVVTSDPDTVCSMSVIDVPFISTGVYLSGNDYIAQLSNAYGKFMDTIILSIDSTLQVDTTVMPPDTTYVYDTTFSYQNVYYVLGMSENDNTTYDPEIGSLPGTVSGKIPRVPEGCNYYIRVVSNRPNVIGSLYGPFCIKHCDITTNKTIDIHVCVHETVGWDTTIYIDIHEWDSVALYRAGNQFIVELLDMMTLGLVNRGGLGVKIDTASTTMILHVPGRDSLYLIGIAPGTYYMRIIADNSTHPWNSNGTIIRLTIGAPNDNPSVLLSDKDVYCNTEVGSITIVPFNFDSQYEWLSAEFFGSAPNVSRFPTRYFSYVGADPGRYGFIVREVNYGCYGPYSPTKYVTVITEPDVDINGPRQVCVGDTFIYSVTFISQTYYAWNVSWGRIVDTSNNEMVITFDSAGTAEIHLYAINDCGVKTGTYLIQVTSILDVDAGDDVEICQGETAELRAVSPGILHDLEIRYTGGLNGHGNMFDIRALDDVTIAGFDVHMNDNDTADFAVYYRPAPYAGAENDPTSWLMIGSASSVISSGFRKPTRLPIPVSVNISSGETYSFYITTTDSVTVPFTRNNGANPVRTDAFIEFHKGTGNQYPFGTVSANIVWNGTIYYRTQSGIYYSWSNNVHTAENPVTPSVSSLYSVSATDTAGCGADDSVYVTVNPLPEVNAGQKDTVFCQGVELQLNAHGADKYIWTPADGLSDASIANPVAKPQATTVYLLQGTDTSTGCLNYDTLTITIDGCVLTLTVPQAFTPNGDGANERFNVFGEYIDRYEISIFNRWGEQVYYSNSISDLCQDYPCDRGWDGTYNGKPQDTGVFVYYIKASKGSEPPVERKGNVTLIR